MDEKTKEHMSWYSQNRPRHMLWLGPKDWHIALQQAIGGGYPPASEANGAGRRMEIHKPTTLRSAQRIVRTTGPEPYDVLNPNIAEHLYVVVVHARIIGGFEFAVAMLDWLTTPGRNLAQIIVFDDEHQMIELAPDRLLVLTHVETVRDTVYDVMHEVLKAEEPHAYNL